MVRWAALLAAAVIAAGGPACATCPPACVRGGGPAATDCYVQFGGISSTRTTCVDGDPACDADGVVNGVCTIAVDVCVNQPADGCTPDAISGPVVAPVTSDAARALATAVAALDPAHPGCATAMVPLALRASLAGVRGTHVAVKVSASARRTDRDRLVFACEPSSAAPGFAATVQPIFSARCATLGCHVATPPNSTPLLESGSSWAEMVGVASRNVPGLRLVSPGDLRGSYLARKVLGARIVDRTPRMPEGCPSSPPMGGCLTTGEQAAIVAWIAAGAPQN